MALGMIGAELAKAGIGTVMTGIGMGVQNRWNKRAYEQEEKMTQKQFENQAALNQQGHQIQKDMWDYTNYGNQMKHMKQAGLNPALMYGMSGGGGVTSGSQSGGSASKGNAPSQPNVDMSTMMMGLQMANMKAQTRLTNADAKRTEESTPGEVENIELTGNKLRKEVDKIESEIGKNEAAKALATTQKEKLELEKEVLEIDVNFLKENNVSDKEWGIIKAGKQLFGTVEKFMEWNGQESYMVYNPETKKFELVSKNE